MTIRLGSDGVELLVDQIDGGVIRRLARPVGPNLLAERTWATPVPPARSTSYGDEQLDFMASYFGGWHETFPNFGSGGQVLGVPIPFHGDVARSHWTVISATSDSLEMECPSRLPVILRRRIRLEGSSVRIEETARSDADIDVPVLWGHHPVFSARAGMRIDLAGGRTHAEAAWQSSTTDLTEDSTGAWPHLPVSDCPCDLSEIPGGVIARLACVHRPPGAWAALRDPATGNGVALCWNETVFENLWLWLESGSAEFPWFGRAQFLGIEPHSAATPDGIASAVSAGTALVVPARGELSTWLTLSLFEAGPEPVTGVTREGQVKFGDSPGPSSPPAAGTLDGAAPQPTRR